MYSEVSIMQHTNMYLLYTFVVYMLYTQIDFDKFIIGEQLQFLLEHSTQSKQSLGRC